MHGASDSWEMNPHLQHVAPGPVTSTQRSVPRIRLGRALMGSPVPLAGAPTLTLAATHWKFQLCGFMRCGNLLIFQL